MSTVTYYVVMCNENGENKLCFNGNKPFLGPKNKAVDLANFLKSVNSDVDYFVHRLDGKPSASGKRTDRYAN